MVNMKKMAVVAVSALAFALTACQSKDSNGSAKKLVEKTLNGQATITKTFSVNKDLEGFVIKPAQGGQGMVLFAQKNGQYLFAGNLIDASGKNLTQDYTQQYVYSALAKGAEVGLAQTHYVTTGKNSAPHKMYVFYDPNCSACHIFYTDVEPLVKKGDVQIRWVPVAFRAPSSIGKAAHALSGKTRAAQDAALATDEHKFDMRTESGGDIELKKTAANQKFFDQVTANTKFFGQKSFYATPTIVFKDKAGKTQVVTGAPRGPQLTALIDRAGNKY